LIEFTLRTLANTLILQIAMLSFTTQLLATSMISINTKQMGVNSVLEHQPVSQMSSLQTEQLPSEMNMQCCEEECNCSINACQPLAIAHLSPFALYFISISNQAYFYSTHLMSITLPTIYRPPIIA